MDSFSRIMELGFRFNSADTAGARIAAANLDAGKPAVWGTASYSHAPVGILVEAMNRLGEAKAAIDECSRNFPMHDYAQHPEWLDRIVPLNEAGVDLLITAYAVTGTFRSARELFERAAKVGFDMAEAA